MVDIKYFESNPTKHNLISFMILLLLKDHTFKNVVTQSILINENLSPLLDSFLFVEIDSIIIS
jgi:hypothetical protein